MSDELEARLKSVQTDLADVQEQVRELKEQLDEKDASVEEVAAKVAVQLTELNSKKDALAELAREVETLRLEAAQVRGALDDP